MKSELKKFRGISIKTTIGQINFKEYVRVQNSQFDQIYFKSSFKDSICKIYDLSQSLSNQRYNNEILNYHSISVPVIYSHVHCQKFKYKKKDYGLVIFVELRKQQCLENHLRNLSETETCKLARALLILINNMKIQHKIYYNIRPQTIFKSDEEFYLIDTELILKNDEDNQITQFIQGLVEKDYEYWAPEMLDTYSKATIDYSIDLFAVGCILYQIKTGIFPFQTKLSEMHLNYKKIDDQSDLIAQIVSKCLGDLRTRQQLNIEMYIDKLQSIISNQNSPIKRDHKVKSQIRKGSGSGILDNISSVFTKMLNQTQGYFLNYVENNDKEPQQKYLDSILVKIYRGDDKLDKLANIIEKYANNMTDKQFSTIKCCLLIGQVLRKGPISVYKYLKTAVKELNQTATDRIPEINLMVELLNNKINVYKRVKKCMLGNFYLHEVSKFNTLDIKDIGHMVAYLQKLTSSLKKYISEFKNCELSLSITNFICDDIYDLVSMLVMCIIAIRKDNDLQLRNDNLQELPAVQKVLNSNLKKISYLSNFTGAHAIYSIENDYIAYQQEINLSTNPYFSSLEHFYKSSKGYKGLSLPKNFPAQYSSQPETLQRQLSSENPTISPQKKNYFSTQLQEDFEQFNHSNLSEYQQKRVNINKTGPILKIATPKKQQKSSQKNQTFFHVKKVMPPPPQKNNHNNSVSFDDFLNIANQTQHQDTTKNKKVHNQFSVFNDVRTQKQVQLLDLSKKQMTPNQAYGFDEFCKMAAKPKVVPQKQNNNLFFDLKFEELSRMKSPPKFQNNPFEEFTQKPANKSSSSNNLLNFNSFHNFGKFQPVSPVLNNQNLKQILKGLKLKELKDLLKKNQHFVIPYSELVFIKVIGSGSAGEVSSGKYKNLSVAIKKVKFKQNPNALKQFQRQLVTYIKIKGNTNLVSLMGLSQHNGDFYLITQFCQHGCLFDLLHKNLNISLTWQQRLRFAVEIAEGMLFLHEMKPVIIHRDLKSLNVFVAKNDKNGYKMKVADFGLSRSPQAEMMTTQLGTIHWMAPELLEGKQYSLKVDVYSYGVLLWQILSRKTPYNNLQNPMAILKYVVIDKKRPDLQMIPADCPKKLIEIVEKCWAHDPNSRPSFSTIIQQLKMIGL